MTTTLYLIRHGITAANLENRFAGRSDEPLCSEGREQIRGVGDSLRAKGITRIFCGPLPRTRQSGEILSEILGAPLAADPAFNEIDIPHWDSLTKEELFSRFGPQYPTWLATPELFSLPGCETLSQVQRRALNQVNHLLARHQGEKMVLISHLIVLRCLSLAYLGLTIRDFRSIKIANGQILRLRCEDGKAPILEGLEKP